MSADDLSQLMSLLSQGEMPALMQAQLMGMLNAVSPAVVQTNCNGLIRKQQNLFFYEHNDLPICNVCYEKINGSSSVQLQLSGSACYSFLDTCVNSNGLFNVSLWLPSMVEHYPDNKVFPGSSFVFNITARLKQDQVFKYRMIVRHNGQDHIFGNNNSIYYDRDCLVGHDKYKKFIFLSEMQSKHPLIAKCQPSRLIEYGVILHNSIVRFEFNVYKKQFIDFSTTSNHHVGDFECADSTLVVKSTEAKLYEHFDTIAPIYDCTMLAVNKKPTVLSLELIADETASSTCTDVDYHRILRFINDENKRLLGKAMAERDKLKKEHDLLSIRLLELTTTLSVLDDRAQTSI
jgi:hypothetical protein